MRQHGDRGGGGGQQRIGVDGERGADLAGVGQRRGDLAGRAVHGHVGVELVVGRAVRPGAGLLGGHLLVALGRRGGRPAGELGQGPGLVQGRDVLRDREVRVLEVERGGQVAGDRGPPRGHVDRLHPGPGGQELEHRGVVVDVGVDVAAPGPGRADHHRDPGPGADRQPADVLVGHARLGERRELVVEEPIVLVVGDEQGRVLPQLGVRQQRLEHGVHVVRPVVGGEGRVLAVTGRGDDPRHLRQLVALDVADERRQHVRGVGLAQRGRPGVGLPRGHRPAGRQRPVPPLRLLVVLNCW